MNSANELLFYGAVIGALTMLFCEIAVRVGWSLWQKAKLEYQYMKHARLVPYNPSQSCREVRPDEGHKWVSVKLALRGLPYGDYQVCPDCGEIVGNRDHMLSNEALDQIQEGMAAMQRRAEIQREIEDRIDAYAATLINRHIEKNFPEEINDLEFRLKLVELTEYVKTALDEATTKVSAEIEAQSELDATYGDWSSKVKGNA